MPESRIAAIMQPTYLPWLGYFNLIRRADVFVFLDDVQFSPRSWQQRNRVLVQGAPHWLTVPVRRAGERRLLHDVEVADEIAWRRKHVRLLERCYGRHPFFEVLAPVLEILQDPGTTRLVDLNVRIIRRLCVMLDLQPAFHRASEDRVGGVRSEHLLRLCRHHRCGVYLSPRGSAAYLEEDGVFQASEVELIFQDFEPRPYAQRGSTELVSHLSVVDVLANVGIEGTKKHLGSRPTSTSAPGR